MTEGCDPAKHDWLEEYYGHRCKRCDYFVPFGCEPWAPDSDDDIDEEPRCHYCGGEGWGYLGHEFPNDDPINEPDGQWIPCPCCDGSGLARDCKFG